MKNAIKYSSIVIAILLIGFVIGFLVNGRMTKAKIKRWKSVNTEQGFNREFIRVLKPGNEQMEEIKPILKKYADLNKVLVGEQRSEQKELFQDLQKELKPYLTEEQIERMENIKKKRHDRKSTNRKRGAKPENH